MPMYDNQELEIQSVLRRSNDLLKRKPKGQHCTVDVCKRADIIAQLKAQFADEECPMHLRIQLGLALRRLIPQTAELTNNSGCTSAPPHSLSTQLINVHSELMHNLNTTHDHKLHEEQQTEEWLDVILRCMNVGNPEQVYHGFITARLWWQYKIRSSFDKIDTGTAERIVIVAMRHWDSCITGVSAHALDLLQCAARMLGCIWLKSYLVYELGSLPIHCKGALRAWNLLLPLLQEQLLMVDVKLQEDCVGEDLWPALYQLHAGLLKCVAIHHTTTIAGQLALALYRFSLPLQAACTTANLWFQQFVILWHELIDHYDFESNVMQNFCKFVLPAFVTSFEDRVDTLLSISIERDTDAHLCSWIWLLKHRRMHGHLTCFVADEWSRLNRALLHSNALISIAALEVICLSDKKSQELSCAAVDACLRFFARNISSDNVSFRQRLLFCFSAFLTRLRNSCLLLAKAAASLGYVVQIGLRSDWVEGLGLLLPDSAECCHEHEEVMQDDVTLCGKSNFDEIGQNLAKFAYFVGRLLSSDNFYPGACYQRQKLAVEYLVRIYDMVYYNQANSKKNNGYCQESGNLLSQFLKHYFESDKLGLLHVSTQHYLIESIFHCKTDIQEHLLSICMTYFVDIRMSDHQVALLWKKSLVFCNQPFIEEFSSGANVLYFLLRMYRSTLASVGVILEDVSCVQFLVSNIEENIIRAKRNVLDASIYAAGHGQLMCLTKLLKESAVMLNSTEASGIVCVCEQLLNNMLAVMGTQIEETVVAPSFEAIGRAISAAVCEAQLEENGAEKDSAASESCGFDSPALASEYQHVLSWAWLNIKWASDVLAALSVRLLEEKRELQLVQNIGNTLSVIMRTSRHRGAIESVAAAFSTWARAARTAKLPFLPSSLLFHALDLALDSSTELGSTTRRSAGLPLLLTALLSEQEIGLTVQRLSFVATSTTPPLNHTNDMCDWPQVHALHLLRATVRESTLASAMQRYLLVAFRAALAGFNANAPWSVKNAALQLLAALTQRLLGVGRPYTSALELEGVAPGLLQLLNEELQLSHNREQAALSPALLPLLSLLARLSCDVERVTKWPERRTLRDVLVQLLGCPAMHIRVLAARSLLALTLICERQALLISESNELLKNCSSNRRHGALCVLRFLVEQLVSTVRVSTAPRLETQVASALVSTLDLLLPSGLQLHHHFLAGEVMHVLLQNVSWLTADMRIRLVRVLQRISLACLDKVDASNVSAKLFHVTYRIRLIGFILHLANDAELELELEHELLLLEQLLCCADFASCEAVAECASSLNNSALLQRLFISLLMALLLIDKDNSCLIMITRALDHILSSRCPNFVGPLQQLKLDATKCHEICVKLVELLDQCAAQGSIYCTLLTALTRLMASTHSSIVDSTFDKIILEHFEKSSQYTCCETVREVAADAFSLLAVHFLCCSLSLKAREICLRFLLDENELVRSRACFAVQRWRCWLSPRSRCHCIVALWRLDDVDSSLSPGDLLRWSVSLWLHLVDKLAKDANDIRSLRFERRVHFIPDSPNVYFEPRLLADLCLLGVSNLRLRLPPMMLMECKKSLDHVKLLVADATKLDHELDCNHWDASLSSVLRHCTAPMCAFLETLSQ